MKAMILNNYGSESEFELTDIAKPQPGEKEVLIKIEATSVNTVDTMIRNMGTDLPLSPELPALIGMDFAGTVVSIGSNVNEFRVGDEVYGCAGGLATLPGTLAEYISADVNLIAHKPKKLSMREAAALPLVAITALEGLERASISSGQKVLVHGGSGGVGHVAIQLAKVMGADVYSTGGGQKQIDLIKSLGATPINYKTEKVEDYVQKYTDGNGFDIVYDSVGGANMINSFNATKLNGDVVTTVSLLELDLTLAHFKGLSIHVVFMLIPMLHNYNKAEHNRILTEIAKIVDAGNLIPVLDENRYSLEECGDAHARLSSGEGMGKVVVEI